MRRHIVVVLSMVIAICRLAGGQSLAFTTADGHRGFVFKQADRLERLVPVYRSLVFDSIQLSPRQRASATTFITSAFATIMGLDWAAPDVMSRVEDVHKRERSELEGLLSSEADSARFERTYPTVIYRPRT